MDEYWTGQVEYYAQPEDGAFEHMRQLLTTPGAELLLRTHIRATSFKKLA
jgi:hypothetical protein